MKIRRLVKKGKEVTTRRGGVVINLSKKITRQLRSYCSRVKVVGSIRRNEKNPVDIDIVLIPRNENSKKKIKEVLSKEGKFLQGGNEKARFRIKGVNVELYYTIPKEWGATLLAYSSKFGAGIGLRMVAKRKGMKLSQHGLFKNGKRIAGTTEEQIYHALGRPWKPPEKR